jgi:hypothetical protein
MRAMAFDHELGAALFSFCIGCTQRSLRNLVDPTPLESKTVVGGQEMSR